MADDMADGNDISGGFSRGFETPSEGGDPDSTPEFGEEGHEGADDHYETTEFDTRWDIQLGEPEEGVMTVTITVDWIDENGKARSTQIRTLKAGS